MVLLYQRIKTATTFHKSLKADTVLAHEKEFSKLSSKGIERDLGLTKLFPVSFP